MLDALERSQAGDGFDSEFDGFSSDDDRKDDDQKIIGVGLKVPQVMVREIFPVGSAIPVYHESTGGETVIPGITFRDSTLFPRNLGIEAKVRRRSWTGPLKEHARLLFDT